MSAQGEKDICSGGVLADTPPADGYCCGEYASYWNAFLLFDRVPCCEVNECRSSFHDVNSSRQLCTERRRDCKKQNVTSERNVNVSVDVRFNNVDRDSRFGTIGTLTI